MTATEALERRIDELCRENEKLRQDNAKLRGARDVWQENDAKLRELARHLYECAFRHSCTACEYADDACDFDYDMRELGIEVDE